MRLFQGFLLFVKQDALYRLTVESAANLTNEKKMPREESEKPVHGPKPSDEKATPYTHKPQSCLLYTSDAADE